MALAQGDPAPVFAAEELRQILALGPWPPSSRADPTNRVSRKVQAIELGRRLFRDPRMSPLGYIGCVTCHQPDRSFTDLKARAHGLADLPRHTPALANLRLQHWYGWGGSSDSLWMASIRPMLDAREFDGNPGSITRIFERDPELAACYRKVFREFPHRGRERTVVNVGKALAAFVETLVTGRTPFDDFRDALAHKDVALAASYPLAAQRGLKLFVGKAQCVACHNGPNFSDGEFHPGASPAAGVSADGVPLVVGFTPDDTGRLENAQNLKASRYNLLGPYSDDPRRANDVATRRLVVRENMRGKFRTPSLRNVAVTAPYMHNGSVDYLREALQRMPRQVPGRKVPPEALTAQQVDDLAAFLETLTDQYGERRPWVSVSEVRCP